jgi:hypothetical protein
MPTFEPMESFNISLTQQQLNLVNTPGADITAFLNRQFVPSSANYSKLAFELQREFKHGGSPDVRRVVFDRVVYDAAMGKGSFRIVLDIRFTFGCEDSVTVKRDQTSEWTFSLNSANSTLNFYNSPFTEARSTADEF